MYYSLHIPVTAYQKKILVNIFGKEWTLSTRDYCGQMLMYKLKGSKPKVRKKENDGQLYYQIIIPQHYIVNYGLRWIDDKSVKDFLEIVEKRFREGLFIFIDSRLKVREKITEEVIKKYGLEIKTSMLEYCKKFDLDEEDLPYEMLKKDYYRHRVSEKSAVVLGKEYYSTKLSPPQ